MSLYVVDFHQQVSLQRHGGFHLPAVRPAAQLPTEQLEPESTKGYVSVLRHPSALRGTILYESFLLKKQEKLPSEYLRPLIQSFILLLFPEQSKGAGPQHLCGVSQCDQCQLSNQRPGSGCQSHAPPSYTQYSRITCPFKIWLTAEGHKSVS